MSTMEANRNMTSRQRQFSDLQLSWNIPNIALDEETYRTKVLQLPNNETEEQIDERIYNEAQTLGLSHLLSEPDNMSTSISLNTIASEANPKSSLLSQSTAPTSCASSEHRPTTHSSVMSDQSESEAQLPSREKRRSSGFRRGFKKMTGFKKRRSLATSPTLTSITSDSADTNQSDHNSVKSGLKSPGSIKSSKSSWSSPIVIPKTTFDPVDQDAMKRSMECKEMLDLQTAQEQQRSQFLDLQQSLVQQIQKQRDSIKQDRLKVHQNTIDEQHERADRAIEELESRQLEDELKLLEDHNHEKRAVMVRLRHMEAYCQNPTPPPTPVDGASSKGSEDIARLPERKVTERDYHNLAQQYRERDAMDVLHTSKINVLRGKQKKAVENLMRKREHEIEVLNLQHQREIELIDLQCSNQEVQLRSAFDNKRKRLEMRWKTTALIQRTKLERATGLKYAPLPDVIATEEAQTTA